MSERHQHTNLWAEKLQQATHPDGAEAWQAMETLLDREMPVGGKRDRRRWVLLILLLLLLIGVCNCPGRGRWFGDTSSGRGSSPKTKSPEAGTGVPENSAGVPGASVPATGKTQSTTGGEDRQDTSGGKLVTPDSVRKRPAVGGEAGRGPGGEVVRRPGGGTGKRAGSEVSKRSGVHVDRKPAGENNPGRKQATVEDPLRGNQPAEDSTRRQPGSRDPLRNKATPEDSLRKKPTARDSTLKKQPAKDSARKKPAAPPKEADKKENEKGFVVGLGLNQFLPVGGQQASGYNSGGTTGSLSDYIPVPMVRYYINKKLYLQLEVQFNAPQYTKKDLVLKTLPADSLSPGRVLTSSISIQKLFYFNVPLSVHYSPVKNLSLGAGLQYSRLRNAIGSFDSAVTYPLLGQSDSLFTKHVVSLKKDTAYQLISTNEFRFLLDVNYTYKHFVLGVRYNQALSKFINVQATPGTVTQARNSSLQFYLRYILWDGRKKK